MGQGTDSCGGYDVDYDGYEDGLHTGMWVQRNGASVHISKMSLQHLHGARRVAERAAQRATFTDLADQMNDWVDVFTSEIERRGTASGHIAEPSKPAAVFTHGGVKKPTAGSKAQMKCHCGGVYLAREADLARGWALSCSKSCAATRRDFGRPPAKRVSKP